MCSTCWWGCWGGRPWQSSNINSRWLQKPLIGVTWMDADTNKLSMNTPLLFHEHPGVPWGFFNGRSRNNSGMRRFVGSRRRRWDRTSLYDQVRSWRLTANWGGAGLGHHNRPTDNWTQCDSWVCLYGLLWVVSWHRCSNSGLSHVVPKLLWCGWDDCNTLYLCRLRKHTHYSLKPFLYCLHIHVTKFY